MVWIADNQHIVTYSISCKALFTCFPQVDSVVPGDVVKICGMVKVCDGEENNRSKEKSMFLLYILANSVENSKDSQSESENGNGIATEFTLKVNSKSLTLWTDSRNGTKFTLSFTEGVICCSRNSSREEFVPTDCWVSFSNLHAYILAF